MSGEFNVGLPYLMRQNSGHIFRSCSNFLSIAGRVARVVTHGKKLLPFASKLEIYYFCYDATDGCYYFT